MTKFDEATTKALEDTINSNLHAEGTTYQFPEYGIEVDFSLVDEGIHVSDRFISTILDGTCHPIGRDLQLERQFTDMPFFESNGREI